MCGSVIWSREITDHIKYHDIKYHDFIYFQFLSFSGGHFIEKSYDSYTVDNLIQMNA